MNEINNFSNILSELQTTDTSTDVTVQTGASTTDTTSSSTADTPSGSVTTSSSDPTLPAPVASATTITTNPAEIENMVQQNLQNNPEFASLVAYLDGKSPEEKAAILEAIMEQVAGTGSSEDLEAKILNAANSQLDQLAQSASSTDKEDITKLKKQLQLANYKGDHPGLSLYIAAERGRLMDQEGLSAAEAQTHAEASALELIRSAKERASELGSPLDIDGTINTALVSILGDMVEGLSSTELGTLIDGLRASTSSLSVLNSLLSQIDSTNPAEGTAAANLLEKLQFGKTFINSLLEMVTSTQALIANQPQLQGMAEFMDTISEAITNLQQILAQVELQNARSSKEAAQIQLEVAQKKIAETQNMLMLEAEQAEKQKSMEFMKWLMPLLGGLLLVAGAALAIFTMGLSVALIATLAVSLIMFTVTTVLGSTGHLAKGFEAANAAFLRLAKAIAPNDIALQKAIQFMTWAVIAIVLIVAIVLTGGSAAAGVASTVGQAAIATTNALAIQLVAMAVLQSGMINQLFDAIDAGSNPRMDPKLKMGLMIATTIIAAVLLAVLTAKFNSFAKSIKATEMSEKLKSILGNNAKIIARVTQFTSGTTQGALGIWKGTVDLQIAELEKKLAAERADITMLKQMIASLQELLESIGKDTTANQTAYSELSELFKQIVTSQGQSLSAMSRITF